MSNVAIDLTKTVKEIITTMKTAIDNLNSDVATNKTAIDNLKEQILEAVYPVGSVYVSITDSRNPADILGFGTWEALPAGYGLVAQGTATAEDGSTLTFTAGQKSGEFKHQITVGELPFNKRIATDDGWHPVWGNDANVQSLGLNKKQHITQTPFSIMGPQVGAYIWKRIT
uniref:phage baseplate protein n=1 Tax=Megasphaera sp. TaxID=2023260 RepID=UPI00402A2013